MNDRISLRPAVAGLVLASLCNGAQAVPISAFMGLRAQAVVHGVTVSDPQSTYAVRPLTNLAVASSVELEGVRVQGAGTATWAADGNSGTVHLVQGWDLSRVDGAGDYKGANFINEWSPAWQYPIPVWNYRFKADRTGKLSLDYDVVGSGDTFGLLGWNIGWNKAVVGYFDNVYDPTRSGTFVRDVVAGQTYELALLTFSNIFSAEKLTGSMEGRFDFSIVPDGPENPVPEPAVYALFALGGVVMFAVRRRAAGNKA